MSSLAEALAEHGPAFLSKFQDRLPAHVQRVIGLITRCRTGALGGVRYQCASCGHEKGQLWIEKQRDRLMPVHHFLLTFTVPRELGLVLRGSQDDGYRCLFDSSAQSIRDFGAATKSLKGCQLGFFGVLHTWGRDLQTYHPHIHFVVPGGGAKLDEQGAAVGWQSTPKNFLFHHGTLIRPTLKYLAPYVHRVAISDKRIIGVDESSVSYTVRPSKSKLTIKRTIEGEKFVAAFTQHILPKGFHKVRHYGWMSSNSKVKLDEVKWLIWLYLGWTFWLASGHAPQEERLTAPLRCADCGGVMRVVEATYETMALSRGPPGVYIDSG